jgi:tRNA threonylcarbamoyladenosine biosynthesis protein TsaB
MRMISIETSGREGSVAALRGEAGGVECLRQSILPANQRTAQSLAPALRALLTEAGWSPGSIELVAVANGPGSFTGLRLGVTTAKMLAYAVGAEIIGVDTLDVLAEQAPPDEGRVWTVGDAQRQELFAASFEAVDVGGTRRLSETVIMTQEKWLAGLKAGDRVIGPALGRLAARLPDYVVALPQELWQPTAEAVGQVAWRAYRAGRRDDVWQLLPNYIRPSAAEEKRLRK